MHDPARSGYGRYVFGGTYSRFGRGLCSWNWNELEAQRYRLGFEFGGRASAGLLLIFGIDALVEGSWEVSR
jgi:hypothetical protein